MLGVSQIAHVRHVLHAVSRFPPLQNQVTYTASVDIRPEWTVLEQIHFPLLTKLALKVEPPTDLLQCGTLSHYDKTIDRVAPKTAMPLQKTSRAFRSVTASDDPVLRRMSAAGDARVFFTDSVLTALMCTTRSVYSWDIVITRRGNQLWFDKRPDAQVKGEGQETEGRAARCASAAERLASALA